MLDPINDRRYFIVWASSGQKERLGVGFLVHTAANSHRRQAAKD